MGKRTYKVVIVDDEYLIRDLIEESVNWAALNCEIVLNATSALEVLDYIDEHDIDILMADINMPVINGLELAKRVKEINRQIKVVMLTGFDDFEYAKQGIDIGVDGYLLKPVDSDVIGEQIQKIIDDIEKTLSKQVQMDSIMNQMSVDKPMLKEKFLLDMCYGFVAQDEVEERLKYFDIDLEATTYQMAVIEFRPKAEVADPVRGSYAIIYKWKLVLDELLKVHAFSDQNKRLYLLSAGTDTIRPEDLTFVMKVVEDGVNYDVKMGISQVRNDIGSFSDMLQEAIDAMNYTVVKGLNTVCCYDEIGIDKSASDDKTFDYTAGMSELFDKLRVYIQAGLKEEAHDTFDTIFTGIGLKINAEPGNEIHILRTEISLLVGFLNHLVYGLSESIQEAIGKEMGQAGLGAYLDVNEVSSLPGAKEKLKVYVDIYLQSVENENSHTTVDVIDKVKAYVDQNYTNSELTLKGTAAKFFMNPDYLSRIYKKKMGMSFKEYVFNKRMEKAVTLINETDLRSYEIGERVGIIDPNYFSVCFRKYMDMSISAYKRKINKTDAAD